MYSFTQRLLLNASRVREALSFEPAIRPDFSKADLATTLTVMFALLWNKVGDAAAIHRYLQARGSKFDRETVDFLLNAYDGRNPKHHLWTRFNRGDYLPLFEAIPDGS